MAAPASLPDHQPEPICKVQRTPLLQSRPVPHRPLLSSVAVELGAIGSSRWRAAAATRSVPAASTDQSTRAARAVLRGSGDEVPCVLGRRSRGRGAPRSRGAPDLGLRPPPWRWRHPAPARPQLPDKLTTTTKSSVSPIWAARVRSKSQK
jgi:hypothetical protein